MPRGGFRAGAGRPPRSSVCGEGAKSIHAAGRAAGMTPLEYMLSVMNDAGADDARRDRMAQAAAPYVHPKAEAETQGKKAQREAAAKVAERGTDWESLLRVAPAGQNGLGNRFS